VSQNASELRWRTLQPGTTGGQRVARHTIMVPIEEQETGRPNALTCFSFYQIASGIASLLFSAAATMVLLSLLGGLRFCLLHRQTNAAQRDSPLSR
jgi:hypothetical protein